MGKKCGRHTAFVRNCFSLSCPCSTVWCPARVCQAALHWAGPAGLQEAACCPAAAAASQARAESSSEKGQCPALGALKAGTQCWWHCLFWEEGCRWDKFKHKSSVTWEQEELHTGWVLLLFPNSCPSSQAVFLGIFSLDGPFPQRLAKVKSKNKC